MSSLLAVDLTNIAEHCGDIPSVSVRAHAPEYSAIQGNAFIVRPCCSSDGSRADVLLVLFRLMRCYFARCDEMLTAQMGRPTYLAIQSPIVKNYDLSSVEALTCGAAPVSAELTEGLMQVFPKSVIGQGYGMFAMLQLLLLGPLTSN